jgi:hypothetical protein
MAHQKAINWFISEAHSAHGNETFVNHCPRVMFLRRLLIFFDCQEALQPWFTPADAILSFSEDHLARQRGQMLIDTRISYNYYASTRQ